MKYTSVRADSGHQRYERKTVLQLHRGWEKDVAVVTENSHAGHFKTLPLATESGNHNSTFLMASLDETHFQINSVISEHVACSR